MSRFGAALMAAMTTVALLGSRCPTVRAGEDWEAKARPPAAKMRPGTAFDLEGEIAGAGMVGWIRDPSAAAEGVPLATWLGRLDSIDAAEAAAAKRVFVGLGTDALPWIAVGLGSASRPTIRGSCAELAAGLAPVTAADGAAAATDPRPWRRRVAWAAARRGGLPEGVRREALGDDDPVVRREAAVGFLLAPPAEAETLASLEAALADADAEARTPAALALLRAGGPAAARFAIALERPEARDRFTVTFLVGLPTEAADAILPLLTSKSWRVRSHAVTALALAPSIPNRALRAITEALPDPSGDVRWRAACALARSEAQGAEARLRERLSDPVADVRTAAAVALAALGSIDEAGVPPLVAALLASPSNREMGNLLRHYSEVLGPNWFLAFDAPLPAARVAEALGRHGPAGVAALRPAAKSADAIARRRAVAAYDAAGDAGVEALRESMGDADEGVGRAAAVPLARRGDARVEVVRALAHQVSWDPFVEGHRQRLDALLSLGAAALPAIRALLQGADHDLLPGLGAALVALGERGAPAIPEVLLLSPDRIDMIAGEGSSSTSLFEKAIRSIGAAGVPGLVAAIRSEDAVARELAFRACLLLGPAAKPALPAMREALAARRIPGWEDTPADATLRAIEDAK